MPAPSLKFRVVLETRCDSRFGMTAAMQLPEAVKDLAGLAHAKLEVTLAEGHDAMEMFARRGAVFEVTIKAVETPKTSREDR